MMIDTRVGTQPLMMDESGRNLFLAFTVGNTL
jgi:hypothetical protein